ncbi:MAG: ABC transporter ATP-binding protein/permease [Peptococcaceae bacterium]|jgi:ATP-binding cassette subfamily C protein|nr:ABC transporter ATP-binding protein/permease [Peptococcaceae bacterium]
MKRDPITLTVRLMGLVKPMLPTLLLAVILGSAGFITAIAIPVLGGMSVAAVAAHAPLRPFLWTLLACGVLRGFLRYAEQYCNHSVAFRLLALVRDRVFRALRRLTPAKLEGRNKGDLISLITTDIELLEVFYAHTISPVLIAVLVSLCMVVFIGWYHLLLGVLAAVGYLSVGVLLPLVMYRAGGNLGLEYRQEFGALNGYVLESQRGLCEIIQFGAEQRRFACTRQKSAQLHEKGRKLKILEGHTAAVSGALILLFSFGMLAAGLSLYQNGALGFDGVLIPVMAMMSSFGPVLALANLAGNLTHTFAAGNRVLDILEETPITQDVSDGVTVAFSGAACEYVSFSYEDEPILRDFSLEFPLKQIIGITGRSGSGKSTLLRMLMRFWDVRGGQVSVSGQDIRSVNTSCLRNLESLVTQDTHLFADTIENNIRVANAQASRAEVIRACQKAAVHDFIQSLPEGYATHLGELGEGLSGGERQRLGLARAFLHDAPFLLLDEPTSNLDSLNEGIILKALRDTCNEKTVVLVSHRRSTMGIADTLHTVERGRVS